MCMNVDHRLSGQTFNIEIQENKKEKIDMALSMEKQKYPRKAALPKKIE